MSLFAELKRRNVIRVAAAYVVVGWIAFEVAKTLFETFGAPDWVAQALIVVLAIGFLPVIIFSWVYELTPEGVKKEREVPRDASITAHTGRKLDLITIGAVIVGILFLGVTRFMLPAAPESVAADETQAEQAAAEEVTKTYVAPDEASVAVLPFANMSGNAENEYFSDGLTETLLHMLAQIPELKVAARTSSFAFKGRNQDIREIATALDVAHVLEGSVQRAGDRVRITAQLIRADDGFHVWSENFDRTLTDIFAIQDEIANEVGGALSASLLGEDEKIEIVSIETDDIGAYESYLEALSQKAEGSYGSLREAERLLKDALSKDPDFVDAMVELAAVYWQQQDTGLVPREQSIMEGRALLRQALAARPKDTRAKALDLIFDTTYRVFVVGDAMAMMETIPALERLVERAPNEVEPMLWLAGGLGRFGRGDEALEYVDKVLALDALNPRAYYVLGDIQLFNRRPEQAQDAFQRSLELKPDQPNAYAKLGDALAQMGDAAGWFAAYVDAMEVDQQDHELPAGLAEYLYVLGLFEHGDGFLKRAQAMAPAAPATRRAAMMRAFAMGDAELAYELATRMIDDDVADRHGAFSFAVAILAQISRERGEARNVFEFLGERYPGIHSSSTELPLKVVGSRFALIDIWLDVMPQEDVAQIIDEVIAAREQLGLDASRNSHWYVYRHVLAGELESAAEVALTHELSRPVPDEWLWRYTYSQDIWTDLIKDPRIAAELQRLDREEAEARQAVVEYLESRT